MVVPVAPSLLRRAHRYQHHPRRPQAVFNNAVDGIAIRDIQRLRPILVAIGFERLHSPNQALTSHHPMAINRRKKPTYPTTKSSRMTPPQFFPSRVSRPGRVPKLRFVHATATSPPPPLQSTSMPETDMR